MNDTTAYATRHETAVEAGPGTVFGLIADAAGWPQVFAGTVHAEVSEESATGHLCRIWQLEGDGVRTWESRRRLDWERRRVSFDLVDPTGPHPPTAGEWQVGETEEGWSTVVLRLRLALPAHDQEAGRRLRQSVDRRAGAGLAELRTAVQTGVARAGLQFTFSDSQFVDGTAEDVFGFLDRPDQWPESSVRIRFDDRLTIVHKELAPPSVIARQTGRWVVEREGSGARAIYWQTVTLDPVGVFRAFGAWATLEEARAGVRRTLGAAGTERLRLAREYAEELSGRTRPREHGGPEHGGPEHRE